MILLMKILLWNDNDSVNIINEEETNESIEEDWRLLLLLCIIINAD